VPRPSPGAFAVAAAPTSPRARRGERLKTTKNRFVKLMETVTGPLEIIGLEAGWDR
jgi:hypothetical protein